MLMITMTKTAIMLIIIVVVTYQFAYFYIYLHCHLVPKIHIAYKNFAVDSDPKNDLFKWLYVYTDWNQYHNVKCFPPPPSNLMTMMDCWWSESVVCPTYSHGSISFSSIRYGDKKYELQGKNWEDKCWYQLCHDLKTPKMLSVLLKRLENVLTAELVINGVVCHLKRIYIPIYNTSGNLIPLFTLSD